MSFMSAQKISIFGNNLAKIYLILAKACNGNKYTFGGRKSIDA